MTILGGLDFVTGKCDLFYAEGKFSGATPVQKIPARHPDRYPVKNEKITVSETQLGVCFDVQNVFVNLLVLLCPLSTLCPLNKPCPR